MRAAFLHFDKDNSGTISREELREALRVRVLGEGGVWGGVAGAGGMQAMVPGPPMQDDQLGCRAVPVWVGGGSAGALTEFVPTSPCPPPLRPCSRALRGAWTRRWRSNAS